MIVDMESREPVISISSFARKYYRYLESPSTEELCAFFDSMTFPEECWKLGFEMDCGNSFREAYGDAFESETELCRVIDEITDVKLLGSAIFSKWRYFNHWAYNSVEEYMSNPRWFLIALRRLMEYN